MAVQQLKDDCDQLFLKVDRRLLTVPGQDPFNPILVLGYNLRLMKDYTDEILSYAHEYDAPDMPAVNGFWSWARVVNHFAHQVLSSFSSRGIAATLQDQHLIRTSLILIYALDLVIKIRVDLIAQSSAKETSSSESSGSMKVIPAPSLFSPYESCFSEAILLYNQTMEDSDLGTKERIQIWRTLMSLMTDKTSLPISEITSFGSSLIHENLISRIPVPYIPFLTNGSRLVSRSINVSGCEWVVNAGQKRQIYRREDYNNKTHVMNYHYNSSSCQNSRKVLVLFLRESWNECCRNLANDTGLPCLDVFSHYHNLSHFNESLQQLIDVYAWINSRSSKKSLGFRPEKVILVGHGVAGSLAVSLCVLINEIRLIRRGMPLPYAVIAVRSKFNCKLALSPSSAFTFLTCMNGRVIESLKSQMQALGFSRRPAATLVEYSKDMPVTATWNSSLQETIQLTKSMGLQSNFPLKSILLYSQQHLLDRFNLIHSLNLNITGRLAHLLVTPFQTLKTSLWDQKPQPIDLCKLALPSEKDAELEYEEMFYECPKRVTEWDAKNRKHSLAESHEYSNFCESMKQFNDISSSALISPLLYQDFKSLQDVRLHLVTSHFDPAIDDSISMCKSWAGFSQIHLIEENTVDQYLDQINVSKLLSKTHGYKAIVAILKDE